jgi:hypothetical protein
VETEGDVGLLTGTQFKLHLWSFGGLCACVVNSVTMKGTRK